MKKIIGVILIVMMISSCATTNKANKGRSSKAGAEGLINENFNPLILNDDDLTVKKDTSAEVKSDYSESFMSKMEDSTTGEKIVNGYRVQICAVSDKEVARDTQREAILKFLENTYLIYDSPYYKVRIGDCTTRFEADKLQKLAIDKGFNDAWVVKTKVKMHHKNDEEKDTINFKY